MHSDCRIWKKIFAGMMIVIYLGGIFSPVMIYFVHDVYHIMTHTVYQHFLHQYQHFKGIAHDHSAFAESHGHTHNGFIDFALQQVDHDKSRQRGKEAPATLTTFKYNEHVKSHNVCLRRKYTFKEPYMVYDVKATNLIDPEPATPPPKVI